MSFLGKLFGTKGSPKVDVSKRFVIEKPIGNGTMSKVFKATDTKTGRPVALKILDKEKTIALEKRFVGMNRPSEGEISVSLVHPHIVRTLEHGWTTNDEQFLVMEFFDGVGIQQLVASQNPFMKQNCLSFCIQLGEALAYLHSMKFIHRDLCPRNILVNRQGQLRLIDFGLVVPDTPLFRKPGNRTGTANYMAPELVRRQPTDQRIDVFSYAVTCYEFYSKSLPWPSANSLDAVMQHVNVPPADLSTKNPEVPRSVSEIIMKGLAVDPSERWQTVQEMVDAFKAVKMSKPQ